ncbi:uncharacterized protein LOC106086200 [Stomoxys calcitrans]|uniref:Uncharacterized protein n=1 Tax=Stomoxys calcitrans TaxID=35570 RepID=A0A1I8Q6W3_STOCA|nr:uncharacterized protein LOC106086200 [Stomoxys calcitrans]
MSAGAKKLSLKLEYGKNGKGKNKQQDKIAQWGVKKFDPIAQSNEPKSNPFRGPSTMKKFDHDNGMRKKFNSRKPFKPKAPLNVKPEDPTPWHKFKDEINNKQREDEHTSKQANWDTDEAKKVLQQREQNYRKLLMEQKRNEATSWEDFGEGSEKKDEVGKSTSKAKNKKEKRKHKKSNDANDEEGLVDTSSPKKQKQSYDPTPLVDKQTLKDFDASKLDFKQKDKIRQMLTKATMIRKGSVGDALKHFQNKKKKLHKNK